MKHSDLDGDRLRFYAENWRKSAQWTGQQIKKCLARAVKAESSLAAANATIAALQADLAGTAELLLREQALAESRSLALATMREALTEISGGAIETLDFTDRLYTTGRVADGVQIEFETHGPARRIREIKALIAQPDDAAAALAGAVLAAADRMGRALDALVLGDATPAEAHAMLDDYLRARAALRGGGVVEG